MRFENEIELLYAEAEKIKLEADAIHHREVALGREPNKCEEFAEIVGRFGKIAEKILKARGIIS